MSLGDSGLRDRLIAQLVMAAILSGLLAAAAGILLVNRSTRMALRDEVIERNALLAAELATRMDFKIETALGTMRLVSTRTAVAGLHPEAAEDLQVVLNRSPEFDELVLYDGDGRPVAVAASRRLGDPAQVPVAPDADAWVEHEGGVIPVETFPPTLRMAVAVESPPGHPVGVLVGYAQLEVIGADIARVGGPDGIVSMLTGRDGRILIHLERDRVAEGEILEFGRDLPMREDVGEVIDLYGQRMVVAGGPLAMLDATVVVIQPEAVALIPATRTSMALAAILVLAMGTALLTVSLLGGWLLGPLTPLAAAVARVGAGERGIRVQAEGRGEVAMLAEEFNRMAAALDQREEEVSQLQRLSLLAHAHGDRETLIDEVVKGAQSLLGADGCALCLNDPVDLAVVAWRGLQQPAGVDDVARHARTTEATLRRAAGGGELIGLPIAGAEDTALGALVGLRWAGAFSERERELGEAVAAIAGVALAQVRRLELERTMVEGLQESVDRRRALIGGITHEFRTPLTCIEGFSSALLDRWDSYDDAQRRELIGKVNAHGRDLDVLVSRLLDFAVVERGQISGRVEPVAVEKSVRGAIEGLGSLIEERRVVLEIEDCLVLADSTLLGRTLANLISNAVKYSPAAHPVVVRARVHQDEVWIDVTDRGIGMSPQEVERAFEPFWRAGHPEMRSVRGLGLGLSLVAEYARAMGARVRVASEPGQGSTFSLTLRAAGTKTG